MLSRLPQIVRILIVAVGGVVSIAALGVVDPMAWKQNAMIVVLGVGILSTVACILGDVN